ncbi:MAG TPA: hypothetical protein VNM48_03810 [Chloroflexota bacterium]|nr:hypothetical protein [Chloroflexota bacterium]
MALILAPTPPPQSDTGGVSLGRIHAPDPRDARYSLRSLLAARPPMPRLPFRIWLPCAPIDQEDVSSCVEHGFTHRYLGHPIQRRRSALPWRQHEYYRACQTRDEWEGESYEGTSLRAGARYGQELGLIESYWWVTSLDDMLDYVLAPPSERKDGAFGGTLIMGTHWAEGMCLPDANGFIHYSGRVLGGHCYLIYGASLKRRAFRYQNSHRRNMRGWISFADAERLLADQGEAMAVVEAIAPGAVR